MNPTIISDVFKKNSLTTQRGKPSTFNPDEVVYYPASAKLPAPGYVGPIHGCLSEYKDKWCWHLNGHDGYHEDKDHADGLGGKRWR